MSEIIDDFQVVSQFPCLLGHPVLCQNLKNINFFLCNLQQACYPKKDLTKKPKTAQQDTKKITLLSLGDESIVSTQLNRFKIFPSIQKLQSLDNINYQHLILISNK